MIAPYTIDGAVAAPSACNWPLSTASFQAMYSKKATPPHWINWVRIGQRSSTSCRPRPISINSNVKPSAAPNTCFWLAANPKRAPLLRATTLTGPGVMEVARANAAMEMIKLIAVPFRDARRMASRYRLERTWY
ncbi:hypothetical protein C4J88_2555 [Pseudomonas sp. R4-39-08]|nr:hypothetical protein C4J88_2555 [Pseudomonas sp. R4-39-08]